MRRVGVIVLAAGESSRLGQPKQLLPFRGRTLLRHVLEIALASQCAPVNVVLGAGAEKFSNEIPKGVVVINNGQWSEGLASSIRAGVSTIAKKVDEVILMLCDQPLISVQILNQLAAHDGLAAAEYGGSLGVPALFPKEYFPELLALQGREGARKILQAHASKVGRVPWPEGEVDIDTVADYQRLQSLE